MRLISAKTITVLALSSAGFSNAVDYVRTRQVQRQKRAHDSQRKGPKMERFSQEENPRRDNFVEDLALWERFLISASSLSVSTQFPVTSPTNAPLKAPTKAPKRVPTNVPVAKPTKSPVKEPTPAPSFNTTGTPVTLLPTAAPVDAPVLAPTVLPVKSPTAAPVRSPTETPSLTPTAPPTNAPAATPVLSPTDAPISVLTDSPTNFPSDEPSNAPVSVPTDSPTNVPTASPVVAPTNTPVSAPSDSPTNVPSASPEVAPTNAPVTTPTNPPSDEPTTRPTRAPVGTPTAPPKNQPTKKPVVAPTDKPTAAPIVLPTTKAPAVAPDERTLLQIIQDTPELSTFLTAIETSDRNREIPPFIAKELNGTDALTVFAPINSGFDALETVVPGYLAMLLTPEFGLHLFSILGHHVTSGSITTADFPIADLPMFAEGTIDVTGSAETGFNVVSSSPAEEATILEPIDIRATNGILHLVNQVLVPQFVTENLVSALEDSEGNNFSTLLRLIRAAGLDMALAEMEGVTLLAPTNDAIPPETEQFLLAPGNEDILNATINYHVINQLFNYAAQSIPNILLVETLQGENIVVGLVRDGPDGVAVSYNQATQQGYFPVQQNIGYIIDRILVPTSLSTVVPRSINNIMRDPSIKLAFSYATTQDTKQGGFTLEESAVREKAAKNATKEQENELSSDIDVSVTVNGHAV